MPKRKENSVDIINQSIKVAGERSFQMVHHFINQLPDPLGADAPGEQLTLKQIEALMKGD